MEEDVQLFYKALIIYKLTLQSIDLYHRSFIALRRVINFRLPSKKSDGGHDGFVVQSSYHSNWLDIHRCQ